MKAYLVTFALFALAFSLANASDPDPLQDFCVALKAKDYSNSAGTHFSFSFLKFLLHFCHVNHSFEVSITNLFIYLFILCSIC